MSNPMNLVEPFSGITGPSQVVFNETHQFSYCPTNFPYIWKWKVSGDAKISKEWVTSTCYYCEIKFGKQPGTITFEQSTPPGVPQVFNETKYVNVVKKP